MQSGAGVKNKISAIQDLGYERNRYNTPQGFKAGIISPNPERSKKG